MARVRFKSPALSFNGVDNYVEMSHHAAYNVVNLTIEAWVKPNVQSGNGGIFEKSIGEVVNTQYSLFQNAATWTFRSGTVDLTTPIAAEDVGVWVHLRVTYDGTNKRLYKNGVLVSGPTASGALATGTGKSRIGALFPSVPPGFQYPFNGLIDEVRLWSVVHTDADIYRRLVGNESGLVGYWRIDENAGGQAKDSTANANHGTITGATWAEREIVAGLSALFEVDWDGDGTYDDVTPDLSELTLEQGRSTAFGSVVAGSLRAVLKNTSGMYSLDVLNTVSPNLRPYRPFRLNLLAGSTSFPIVSGKIFSIEIQEEQADENPTVLIEGRDIFSEMDIEARVDTMQNATTKTLAEVVLNRVGVTSSRRVLSIVGDSIPFAFGERRSARSWMDAIALFGYRQYVDRQGRYALLDRLTSIQWAGDRIDSAEKVRVPIDDEGLTTRVRVLVHPFKAHTVNRIIWTSGEVPFTLVGKEERTILASFRDPDKGVNTGAISLVTPVATEVRTGTLTSGSPVVTGLSSTADLIVGMIVSGTGVPSGSTIKSIDSATQITLSANATATGPQSLTFSPMDYAATSLDGSQDQTSQLTATLIGNPGTSALLKIVNSSLASIKITVLRVRGKLAVPQDVQATEVSLASDYPDLYRELDADLIQDTITAQTIMYYLAQRFSRPPRRYQLDWSDVDIWPSVILEADLNSTVLLSLLSSRLQWAMTTLRGLSLHIREPMIMDATLDLDFVSLASGPGLSALDHTWDHQL